MISFFFSSLTRTKLFIYSTVFLFCIPFLTFAQSTSNGSLQGLLTNAGFFIQKILIPLLFGIAFLAFLINMVRYFIIGANNEESLKKAKRNTIYSLAAFVFLISIWAIVSMVLGGLKLTQNDVICPDYNPKCGTGIGKDGIGSNSFGGSSFPNGGVTGSGVSGGFGGGSTSGGSNNTGGSGGFGGGSTGSAVANDPNFSGLSELIFGTGKDSAVLTRYTGDPRAVFQTPTIAPSASCTSGLQTLTLANTTETSQAAYVLYKNAAGATRWKNITDLNSTNHIAYDKDALDALLSQNIQNVYIVHTHPDSRTENLNLITQGHAPSAADLRMMCGNAQSNISYAVVDKTGIWTITPQSDTCPYSQTANNILPVLETYANLAVLEASTRQAELARYINSPITPTQYKNHFSSIDTQQFPSLTTQEMLSLSTYYQTYASTTLAYQENTSAFCATY